MTSSYSIQAVAYTASRDGNSLYLADGTEKIYRFNHTPVLNSPSFIYATNHTGSISAMAVSISEVYLASGSSDYTILVHLAHTNQVVCSFTHGNQIRALIFDPNFEAILYAASIDDVIKKWNITGCSLIAEKSVGFSISTMAINQAGTFLAYGTIEGHVGTIDSSLASPSTKTGAHQFTVLKIIYSNNDYYASFGQDSVAKLWKSGSIISTSTSITISRILNCD